MAAISHLFPSELDIRDHSFPSRCMAMTDQMRSEMNELVALTKATLAESRTLMTEIDCMLARR
jgi:hypothetical protein